MTNRPSVLMLDDGELENVNRVLRQLGADVVRLKGSEIGRSVPAPHDLLISAGRRTLDAMPAVLAPAGDPSARKWICVHNQDFLPMRQRLSEMGVHYLVQSALDEDSLRRFLIQLLRSGAEQRRELRLPLGGDVEYRAATNGGSGKLVDLSVHGCKVLTPDAFESGARVTIFLPASLGGGAELELPGTVLRDADCEFVAGHEVYSSAIEFEALDDAIQEQLQDIARGERIGTRITALAAGPDEGHPDEAAEAAEGGEGQGAHADRRIASRRAYDRPVQVLSGEAAGGEPALGHDLSLRGVRLTACAALEPGTLVTIALFGAAREEPLVLDATVRRSTEDGDVALAFGSLAPAHREWLEKLLSTKPLLDALDRPDPEAGRTVVAEVRRAVHA